MKPRHAAALALVVWYLLAPPWPLADPDDPLPQWEIIGSFDSAAECRHDLLGRQQENEAWGDPNNHVHSRLDNMRCIARATIGASREIKTLRFQIQTLSPELSHYPGGVESGELFG